MTYWRCKNGNVLGDELVKHDFGEQKESEAVIHVRN